MAKILVLSKQKSFRTKFNRQGTLYSSYWNVLCCGGIIAPLCMLTGLIQRKSKLSWDCFTAWITAPTEVRLLNSHTDWEVGCHLPRLHFKRMARRSLRKTVLGCKTAKRLLKSFKSQRDWKFCNYKFSKVNAARKGRSEAGRQEGSLKFSQVEQNLKAHLVSRDTKKVLFLSSRTSYCSTDRYIFRKLIATLTAHWRASVAKVRASRASMVTGSRNQFC